MSVTRSPSKEKLNEEVVPELVVHEEPTAEETNVKKVTEELEATKLDDSAKVTRQDSENEEKKEVEKKEEATLNATAEKEPEVEKAAEEENSDDKTKVLAQDVVPTNFGTLPQTTFGARRNSKPEVAATLTSEETPRPRSPGGSLS